MLKINTNKLFLTKSIIFCKSDYIVMQNYKVFIQTYALPISIVFLAIVIIFIFCFTRRDCHNDYQSLNEKIKQLQEQNEFLVIENKKYSNSVEEINYLKIQNEVLRQECQEWREHWFNRSNKQTNALVNANNNSKKKKSNKSEDKKVSASALKK